MDLDPPNLLWEASRLNRQAQEAERKGHYRQALDKYTRAVAKYRQACKTKQHPKCIEILQLLIAAVQRNADYVQSYIEKGLLYRSQCRQTFRPMTMTNQNLLDLLTRYVEDFTRIMHKILDGGPADPLAGRSETESSALSQGQRSDCLKRVDQFRELFECEIIKAKRSNIIAADSITRADYHSAQEKLLVSEANLTKCKAALDDALSLIDSQKITIEEQRKMIEKYQTQWQLLKERARMKR